MTAAPPPRRLLPLGDAASRPDGLERALARSGDQLLEAEGADVGAPPAAPPDLLLVAAPRADQRIEAVLGVLNWAGCS